jgi:hypothetical protein
VSCFSTQTFSSPAQMWLQATPQPPRLNRAERQALFEKCLTCRTDDSYPAGWFTAEMTRESVKGWMLWSLFSCDVGDMDESWTEEMDGYLQAIENTLGRRLECGGQPTGSMRLNFDPVVMVHRPFIWYMVRPSCNGYRDIISVSAYRLSLV